MSAYHIWPCDTWCSEENLEKYLLFMSDDYITINIANESEDFEIPSYDEAIEKGLTL